MHPLRQLLRQPGPSLVIVVTLALGIGANTAIFGFVDRLLLRPLPVERPGELVVLGHRDERGVTFGFNYPLFEDLRDRSDVFRQLSAQDSENFGLAAGGATERVRGLLVSGDYFRMLGIDAALGRTFGADEGRRPGDAPVLLLGHGYWRRAFGADPGVVGRAVTLNGQPFTVVGVTPPGFSGTELGVVPDIYVPITMHGALFPAPGGQPSLLSSPRFTWHQVMGRLAPGVSPSLAEAALRRLAGQLRTAGHENVLSNLVIVPGLRGVEQNVREARLPLTLLGVVVALVLLVACGNVAGLQIARSAARSREIAVRAALGASRRQLIGQLFLETAWLSGLGGLAGLGVARLVGRGLLHFQPPSLTAEQLRDFLSLDTRVLAFTSGAALLTALATGLFPAWIAANRADLVATLKSLAGPLVVSRAGRPRRLRAALVSGQVALATVCLVCASLCLRSIHNLVAVDPGFEPARVLAAGLDLRLNRYDTARAAAFYDRLLDRLRQLPGVEAVGLGSSTPLGDSHRRRSVERLDGFEIPRDQFLVWHQIGVSPGFFRTLGLRLLLGRDFGSQDTAQAPRVVVINQTAAARYWPGQDPVGRFVFLSSFETGTETAHEIIGVVSDAAQRSLATPPEPAMYHPLSQDPTAALTLLIRSASAPAAIAAALPTIVRDLDPAVPVFQVRTLEVQRDGALVLQRLVAASLAAFALLALFLAALGIHGILAFDVQRRSRELGVRLALGARLEQVLHLVLRDGLRFAGIGGVLGLILALAGTRALRGFLYEVTPSDPLALLVTLLALAVSATLASWFPARRAMRLDPATILRAE